MSLELDVPGYVECRHQSLACIVNISMMDGVVVFFLKKEKIAAVIIRRRGLGIVGCCWMGGREENQTIT